MSLQFWYTEKKVNKGLGSYVITSDTTTDFSFDGDLYVMVTDRIIDSTFRRCSICAFVKLDSNFTSGFFYSQGYSDEDGRFYFLIDNSLNLTAYCKASGKKISIANPFSINKNRYNHICIVINYGIYYYINGKLVPFDSDSNDNYFNLSYKKDASYSLVGNALGSEGEEEEEVSYAPGFRGQMRDFRIYNHVLSKKEIKEISKGLILHYKMDENSFYDCSGLGNNGAQIGGIVLAEDSPRYDYSSYFDGSTQYIEVPEISPEEITVAFWFKRNSNDNISLYFCNLHYGVRCSLLPTGEAFFEVFDGDAYYGTLTYDPITVENGWTHFAGTFSKGNIILYINGEKIEEAFSAYNTIAWHRVSNRIGTDLDRNSFLNGQMSDFRIYLTALSEEDIQELYRASAAVDAEGNLYVRENIESDDSTIRVEKSGIFNNIGVTEGGYRTRFYSLGSVKTNTLYEY